MRSDIIWIIWLSSYFYIFMVTGALKYWLIFHFDNNFGFFLFIIVRQEIKSQIA